MKVRTFGRMALAVWLLVLVSAVPTFAQVFEAVGSRALGMGGAFVAVASDSSASWWNPAGLADGPFVDLAFARAVTERLEPLPGSRDRASWFALGTPPLGVSLYRLRITDIAARPTTAEAQGGREDRTAGTASGSSSVSQLGVTLLRTVLPGVHAGSTIKYVRGTPEGGKTDGRVDLDVGVLAVGGPLRLGAVVRNLREEATSPAPGHLPRQVRFGAAVELAAAGGPPTTIAIDGDARSYETAAGRRGVIAVGAEQWLLARRLGVRAGGRFNRVGAKERSATGGVSVGIRSGAYLEAHVVGGGSPEERGWGVALRVSY